MIKCKECGHIAEWDDFLLGESKCPECGSREFEAVTGEEDE